MKQSGLKVENSTDMDWKQIFDILIQQFFPITCIYWFNWKLINWKILWPVISHELFKYS